MKIEAKLLFFLGLTLALIANFAIAEVPQQINYQGYLKDADGNPVADGSYFIKFKIYGSESGNDSLWSSGFQSIQTTDGLFSYRLGSFASFPPNLFTGDPVRYLGLTVGTDNEISPRLRILSSAYAIKSNSTDTAGYAEDIADDCVTGSKIPPNTITSSHISNGTIGAMDVDNGEIQLRVSGDCPPGYYISEIDADGNITCVEDQIGSGGDITGVYADGGLTGGGTEGDAHMSVGAGNGILVNPDDIAVDIEGLAGRGLYETNDSLSVQTGTGLEVYADVVQLQYQYSSGQAYDDRFVNTASGSLDFLDEPGVAEEERDSDDGSGCIQLPTNSYFNLESQTITCPTDGYVFALASFTLYAHSQAPASAHYARFGVSNVTNQWANGIDFSFRLDQALNYDFRIPSMVHSLFTVSEGPNTFYFLGFEQSGHLLVCDIQLTLIFFPTAYGPVYQEESAR